MSSNWGGGTSTLKGGAIHAFGRQAGNADLKIFDSTFEQNQAHEVSAVFEAVIIQKPYFLK